MYRESKPFTMSVQKLTDRVAEKTNFKKSDVKVLIDAVLLSIKEEVAENEKLTLIGFGSFKQVHKAARTGRNPKTGAPIEIPARTAVTFKAAV